MTLFFVPILLIITFLGFPLFLSIGGLALWGYSSQEQDLRLFFGQFLRLTSSPLLSSIPLFTFSGYILAHTNAPNRLLRVARAFVGWIPGGVGIVAVLLLAVFTSFTGASGVTIIALGGLFYPFLQREGFSEKFSLGLITATGSVGLLFPPSLPLIIYAILSEVPVHHLFLAGLLPGTILVLSLSLFVFLRGKRLKGEISESSEADSSFIEKVKLSDVWEALLPLLVMGLIYLGLATVTETAVITVVYVLLVESLIHKDLTRKLFIQSLKETVQLVGAVMVILGSALALTDFFIYIQLPQNTLNWMQGWVSSSWEFLIVINLLLLITGCLMDIFSALVVIVPLVLPLAKAYGIDPIHLGIIFLTNLEIGYFTPPVGLNLFIASYRFNKSVIELYRATVPFLAISVAILILVTYVPEISTILVKWFER